MSTAVTSRATGSGVAPQRLVLNKLRKIYASRGRESFEAVKSIDLEIAPGELIALLGPSGCGKTTTLRMIAGLETVTSGEILIGERSVGDLPPGKRNVGVGFESYALYPPLTVRENLAYGLRARKVADADARVDEIAKRLDMTELLDQRPAGLSSGQKQRVALARALIRKPPVLLLDEPLGHLDASARQRVRRELKLLQREFGYTTIVVTHDQLEALSLADRMAVMDAGVIQQFGTPDEVFDDPANRFVAEFVGEPAINMFAGEVVRADGGLAVRVGDGVLETAAVDARLGDTVMVGLRPQDTQVLGDDATGGLGGAVINFEDLLEFGQASVRVRGVEQPLLVQTPPEVDWRPGDTVRFGARPDRVHLFDSRSGDRIR
ncbi:ABC transporter ATP-binding protein [Naumannella huperziae]